MAPRVVQVQEVPGVEAAISTANPTECATRIRSTLSGGAEPTEVVRTGALVAARHFAPAIPPPHALLALSASLDLAGRTEPPNLAVVQACALAAREWRSAELAAPDHVVSGDELHLARSFVAAVRAPDLMEADAIFSGLVREGDERRLAGDALFEACAQDLAGEGHKLTFAVGSWRLVRSLGWTRPAVLLRPAVHLAAGTTQDLSANGSVLREVGRSRLDLELATRNTAPIDQVARNTYEIALKVGPDRVVADLINGLKRGRAPTAYADLVAATAAEKLITNPAALEPALFALAARFVLSFSRTSTHVLALLLAARMVAGVPAESAPEAVRVSDPEAALRDLSGAIESGNARDSARIALGLVLEDRSAVLADRLIRHACRAEASADAGHRLLYAAWGSELASVAPGPALPSLAAVLGRAHPSRAGSSA